MYKMTAWQKPARIGVATFGIAVAVVVYFSIGSRQAPARPAPIAPLDPKITSETGQGSHQQFREDKRDFAITFKKLHTYEDGSTKLDGPRITVQKSDGRSFVVEADQATSGKNDKQKELSGHVKLTASDGFEMTTDRAIHSEEDSLVRVPGALAFMKGKMSGSGSNGSYDQDKDVLSINEQAAIRVVDDAGHPSTEFSSGSAVLDRQQHVLTLDVHVHAIRGPQIIDTDHSTARLNDNNEVITYLELRGMSRVTGGSAIQSMAARDIDMDYSDDGRTLERVVLTGKAEVTPAAQGETASRTMAAESLDVHLASDGSIASTAARENVRLDLPPSGDAPGGRITARSMDGSGVAGKGLTEARFNESVEYSEPARKGSSARVVRAQSLTTALSEDAVTDAVFTGKVIFEEEDLNATAPEVRYQPSKNTIALIGPGNALASHITIDQIAIDARRIDVALETRRITASQVKTTLRPQTAASRGDASQSSQTRSMPGLLKKDDAANVNADSLEYVSATGQAVYTGNARLFQGVTSISGDAITVDREHGDLLATGSARSTLDLDGDRTTGNAHEIRYVDATRTVTYSAAQLGPTRGKGVVPPAAAAAGRGSPEPVREAQVKGPQGDLRAERIEIVLAKQDNRMERLEAFTHVTLKMDTKTAEGARLTYHAADEQYVMAGAGAVPVRVVVRTAATASAPQACRETTGRTLTFKKATDNIEVDGKDETRIDTRPITCPPQTSR